MNQQWLLTNQQEKISNGRSTGDIKNLILEKLILDGCISTRSDIINYVGEGIGMTIDEIEVMHITSSGLSKNYLSSAVDYIIKDINDDAIASVGDICVILDNTGVWILKDENTDITKFNMLVARSKQSKQDLNKEIKAEIGAYYRTLSREVKSILKAKLHSLDPMVNKAIDGKMSAKDAVDFFCL